MNRLPEGYHIANDTVAKNTTKLANRVFAIASGGLAVSASILTYLHSVSFGVSVVHIIIIIFLYLICIILDTYAIVYARNKAAQSKSFFREMLKCGYEMTEEEVSAILDADNRDISKMNTIATIFLFVVITYTIVYCLIIISK